MQVFLENIIEVWWHYNDDKWADYGSDQFPKTLQEINLGKVQRWEQAADNHNQPCIPILNRIWKLHVSHSVSSNIFLLSCFRNSLDVSWLLIIITLIATIVLLRHILKKVMAWVTSGVSLVIEHLTHGLLSSFINKNEHLLLGYEEQYDLVGE